ncbi:MAG: divalent-cation tolerance protein CutA, partial [Thiohalomonadaceae bacterium]
PANGEVAWVSPEKVEYKPGCPAGARSIMNHCLVITTCPDGETAANLARILVEARLAACVNIVPGVRSIYRWKGELVTDHEHLLLAKTRSDVYPQLEAAIRANHPYELPEVVMVPMAQGSTEYLNWLNSVLDNTQ